MSKRDVAILICRCMALYVFFSGITLITSMVIPLFSGIHMPIEWLWHLFAPAYTFGFGYFLWKKADWISNRMIPADPGTTHEINLDKDNTQTIAFSVMGLYILIMGVITSVTIILQIVILRTMNLEISNSYAYKSMQREQLIKTCVSSAVKIGFGLWLFLGAEGIHKLWNKMRSRDNPQSSEKP
ncbi:MAG: hypothetical protein V1809_03665 [Planctomycetota bacterium]